jgi:hypothetical protein
VLLFFELLLGPKLKISEKEKFYVNKVSRIYLVDSTKNLFRASYQIM